MLNKSRRQEYDFTKSEDVERFQSEHAEANEDSWLNLVGFMEANHDKITYGHTALYKLLEDNQVLLDRIMKRLGQR